MGAGFVGRRLQESTDDHFIQHRGGRRPYRTDNSSAGAWGPLRGRGSSGLHGPGGRRHGPMVLKVCRQVLGDSHDAEDAFQATFLVLLRKAGSVRNADSVASWLHGVAYRVRPRAEADAIQRRAHEQRVAEMSVFMYDPEADRPGSWTELHEEIARLPARYREPLVLCYLEGLTTGAAAQRLRCPQGTILSRLSPGRERLRTRLTRRGLAPVEGPRSPGSVPPSPKRRACPGPCSAPRCSSGPDSSTSRQPWLRCRPRWPL